MISTENPVVLERPFETLARYFRALDRFDIDAVLDCMSQDIAYGHPLVSAWKPDRAAPYAHGRDEVRTFLVEFRGKQDCFHRITGFGRASAATGTEFVEGGDFYFATVTGRVGPTIGAGCSTFEVDADDRISRFSAFMAPVSYDLRTSQDYIAQFSGAPGLFTKQNTD